MSTSIIPGDLVSLPRSTVRALARATAAASPAARIHALRQAGYDGGEEMAAAFAEAVGRGSERPPEELPLEEFNGRVATFFEGVGWGRVSMSSIHDLVAAVDVEDCWEARMHGSSAVPCCHMATGLLAAFFSTFAPYPLATMEVECAATDSAAQRACRFLLGQTETLNDVYARMSRGEDYAAALAQLSGVSASA
jgi:predicted hydrocarbon binding protein